MNNENPYAGITLPEPPAGYRLAKWGEESEKAMYYQPRLSDWVAWGGRLVNRHAIYDATNPSGCIFAIPLDQPSPFKSWQFRELPWVMPKPKTLADCVPSTPVVSSNDAGQWHVVYRIGSQVFCQGSGDYFSSASDAKFVRYLDPPPQKPPGLDDVPDGRVIRCQDRWHWKVGATWWRLSDSGGVWPNMVPRFGSEFTITNYIAELK